MKDVQNDSTAPPEADDLAKDVAHLYSWANVGDASYRDFSRKKRQYKSDLIAGIDQANAKDSHAGVENQIVFSTPASSSRATAFVDTPFPPHDSFASKEPVASAMPSLASQGVQTIPQVVDPGESPEAAAREPNSSSRFTNETSAIAIYSLAGGVGKTSICANLARILCSMGERVLLVDSSGSGLLPFYFGSSDLRPGLRTFFSPGAHDPPIQIIEAEDMTEKWLDSTLKPTMQIVQRTIFDLGPASMHVLPQVLGMCAVLLVPLLSNLNSMLTVSRIEKSIGEMRAGGASSLTPFYIFNRFDENSHRDQQARELVARQCGDRLLPITICRSHRIGEAIADRMTVVDHAPESEVAQDYLRLATWLREIAPVSHEVKAAGRWTEQ